MDAESDRKGRGGVAGEPARPVAIARLRVVGSTNREAERRIAAIDESAGTSAGQAFMVVAREQTGGEGRRGGTSWASPPGGLWATMAWEIGPAGTEEAATALHSIGLRIGLACLRAIRGEGEACASAMLKWPNDVVIDGGKLCGCMGRLVRAAGRAWLLAAAGINANNDLPPDLERSATSLRVVLGRPVDLEALETRLRDELGVMLGAGGLERWMVAEANHALHGVGTPIRLRDGGETVEGVLLGLGEGGTPRVRTPGGVVEVGEGAERVHGA